MGVDRPRGRDTHPLPVRRALSSLERSHIPTNPCTERHPPSRTLAVHDGSTRVNVWPPGCGDRIVAPGRRFSVLLSDDVHATLDLGRPVPRAGTCRCLRRLVASHPTASAVRPYPGQAIDPRGTRSVRSPVTVRYIPHPSLCPRCAQHLARIYLCAFVGGQATVRPDELCLGCQIRLQEFARSHRREVA